MSLLNTPNTAIMPGQRLIKVKCGYQAAEKYPTSAIHSRVSLK